MDLIWGYTVSDTGIPTSQMGSWKIGCVGPRHVRIAQAPELWEVEEEVGEVRLSVLGCGGPRHARIGQGSPLLIGRRLPGGSKSPVATLPGAPSHFHETRLDLVRWVC